MVEEPELHDRDYSLEAMEMLSSKAYLNPPRADGRKFAKRTMTGSLLRMLKRAKDFIY